MTAESKPTTNRYAGQGGRFVLIDGEVFRADEDGNPLPHEADEPVPAAPDAAEEKAP